MEMKAIEASLLVYEGIFRALSYYIPKKCDGPQMVQ